MMRQILLFKIMVMVAFSKNGCKGTKKIRNPSFARVAEIQFINYAYP